MSNLINFNIDTLSKILFVIETLESVWSRKNENFSKTTSITQVIHGKFIKMYYKDLVNQKDYDVKFSS